jgi:Flp pilus assembly protein TadG
MKRATKRGAITNSQKGVVAVEFAIVLPLLAILLVGILEVGGIARDYQVLQNGAREGARFSALPSNRIDYAQNPAAVQSMIQSRVVAYLAAQNITVSGGDVTVDQTYPIQIGALTAMGSRITISYTRPLTLAGGANFIPSLSTMNLVGNAVFRNFY